MSCNGAYMGATDREINLSKVYGLLDELETGKLPDNFGDGYDRRTYSRGLTQEHLDSKTKELCDKLQKVNVKEFSPEMQIWWRDHQKADKERIQRELDEIKTKEEKEVALSKLTAHERKLLGYE